MIMVTIITMIRHGWHSLNITFAISISQELLEQLVYAEECGKLIYPPCYKTGQYCTGKLQTPLTANSNAAPAPLLKMARDRKLAVYPYTFRNEARL